MRHKAGQAPSGPVASSHHVDSAVGAHEVSRDFRSRMAGVLADPARAIFVLGLSAVLSLAIVGLPLAIVGAFHPIPISLLTPVLWLPMTWATWRLTDPGTKQATMSWAVVGIAVAFAIFVTANSGEHVLTNRDPGVYVITGQWLASHGNLVYDTGLPDELTSSLTQSWTSQGIYPGDRGTGSFQFQHLTGVVLAAAQWIGGDWLLFRVTGVVAAISLLGVFLVSRAVAGPVFGAAPVVIAAVHPAFIHFAKDVYSEWYAMSFAMAAFLIWMGRPRTRPVLHYLGVGILLGAGTLARIDAWLTAGAFLAGVGYLALTGESDRPRGKHVSMLVLGFVVLAGLGTVDLVTRSRQYFLDLSGEAVPMILLVFASAGLAMILTWLPADRLEKWSRPLRAAVPWLAVLILVAGMYGLFVRPSVSTPTQDNPAGHVAALQTQEGLAVDGTRTYAESSLEWIARYQGYLAVVFGIGAVSLAWYVLFRRSGDHRVPLLVTLVGVGSVYFYRPSITPDHLWALRRFLPIVLPLAFVFAAWAAKYLVGRLGQGSGVRVACSGVLALALAQAVTTGWPVAAVTTHVGVPRAIVELCEALPTGSVVLVDNAARAVLPGAIRTYCDVPVASLRDTEIVDAVREAGLTPVAVTQSQCGGDVGLVSMRFHVPERTLTRAPSGPEEVPFTASISLTEGAGFSEAAPIPDSAEASIQARVQTDWVPDAGSSVIVALDDYQEGMWLEYQPTGAVELWVTTTAGTSGVLVTLNIDDDEARSVGGYLDQGVLYAVCGGRVVDSQPVEGSVAFVTDELQVNPTRAGKSGNQQFDGTIEVLPADTE